MAYSRVCWPPVSTEGSTLSRRSHGAAYGKISKNKTAAGGTRGTPTAPGKTDSTAWPLVSHSLLGTARRHRRYSQRLRHLRDVIPLGRSRAGLDGGDVLGTSGRGYSGQRRERAYRS